MNALARFLSFGLKDIDSRVAATLTPPMLDDADRYLRDSAIVRTIDRFTIGLQDAWTDSRSGRLSKTLSGELTGQDWATRYQAIGVVVMVAVVTHILLTLVQGARPGWFWLVIPSMAGLFALFVLIASSRSNQ